MSEDSSEREKWVTAVKEQRAVIPESKVEDGRHEVVGIVEERDGWDDLLQVRYTSVLVKRAGPAGDYGPMERWPFQVVEGEVHRPERWGEAPPSIVEVAQSALDEHYETGTTGGSQDV